MKVEDIVKQNEIPEDECSVCYLHEIAYKKISNYIPCPHCKVNIDVDTMYSNIETIVVGDHNGYTVGENIQTMPYLNCPHCDKPIAFKPIPIIYNSNHDIYYTGGKHYLTGEKPKLNDKIKASIIQYTDRIKAGESLEPWNLETWIKYDIEELIATYLYENGLKE
jgi:DNA-directed RNA polymerase subunit RPC12/RpoP